MSWDIIFQDLPKGIKSLSEIEDNFEPSSLCSKTFYLEMMEKLFPNADYSDQSWIVLDKADFSIEFNSGESDPIEALTLHIRGEEACLNEIKRIMEYTGWKGIDTATGELLDASEDVGEGLKEHNDYLEQIIQGRKSDN